MFCLFLPICKCCRLKKMETNTSSHYVLFGLHLLRNTHIDLSEQNLQEQQEHI